MLEDIYEQRLRLAQLRFHRYQVGSGGSQPDRQQVFYNRLKALQDRIDAFHASANEHDWHRLGGAPHRPDYFPWGGALIRPFEEKYGKDPTKWPKKAPKPWENFYSNPRSKQTSLRQQLGVYTGGLRYRTRNRYAARKAKARAYGTATKGRKGFRWFHAY